MRFRTRAVHAGQDPDPGTGDTIPPIHLSTTYTQHGVGRHQGFEYSRTANPTRAALEELVAALEGGERGLAFASGMAATHAVFSLLPAGSHLILSSDVYGGTYRLVTQDMVRRGVDFTLADLSNPEAVGALVSQSTRMIFLETPTNPLLKIADIAALKRAVGERVLVVVDNTFATPYFQHPLDLGADIVVHSSTKYLAGHSDVVGGLVATSDDDNYQSLKFIQNAAGAVPSPFDCYLTIRGIKTLPLRMEAHAANARVVADFLADQDCVLAVYHPSRVAGNDALLVSRQMSGSSGIVSFRIRGGEAAAHAFLENLRLFSLAESLGGVESLACLPAAMTHACFEPELRSKLGITPDLVRLSVGIEDEADLLEDVRQALARARDSGTSLRFWNGGS